MRRTPGGVRTRAAALAGGSAPLLVVALAVSMHLGSAIATGLFGRVDPVGVLWLRCALAALLLVAIFRRRALALPRSSRLGVLALGVVLAAMNACFFEAIARVPLGVASTIEFTGPLLVAVAGSRRPRDVAFAALADVGVALLGSPSAHVDTLGAVLAFSSAACWATYILLAKRLIGGGGPPPGLAYTPPGRGRAPSGADIHARGSGRRADRSRARDGRAVALGWRRARDRARGRGARLRDPVPARAVRAAARQRRDVQHPPQPRAGDRSGDRV